MEEPIKPKCRPKGAIGKARWRHYYKERSRMVERQAKAQGVPVSRLIAQRLEAS